jgi:flagellar hook-associated protein 2
MDALDNNTTMSSTERNDAIAKLKEQQDAFDAYQKDRTTLAEQRAQKATADSYYQVDGDGNPLTDGSGNYIATAALEDLVRADVTTQSEDAAAKIAVLEASIDDLKANQAVKINGQDSEIWLNGAQYVSDSNTLEVNGLTITAKGTSKDTNGDGLINAQDDGAVLTTADDSSGVYDMVKKFLSEYNKLINEIDKLYGADAAKGFEPLTAEEKDTMSEKEAEEYEQKIKDALLRKDSTLATVGNALKTVMNGSYDVNGKSMRLSSFGVEQLSYFVAASDEKNAFHILGDKDDPEMLAEDNLLEQMITADPETVSTFFQSLSKSLYDTSKTLMARESGYKSSLTIYADVKLREDYNDYSDKISKMEDDLKEYEDRWFDKFTAMETALAKLQSSTNAISGLLGG